MAALLVMALLVAAAAGIGTWSVLGRPDLAIRSLPGSAATEWSVANTFDAVKIVLAVVAGIGGVVALTVAYRKQDHGEAAEYRENTKLFNERFGKAAEQLGADKAAVRLAGAYAMAGLADDWDEGRQTCIDVLCAYLRKPYDSSSPATSDAMLSAREEGQVRNTVITLIRDHLMAAPIDTASRRQRWHGHRFDLSGATLDGGDLSEIALLADTLLDFSGAEFTGRPVSFANAEFSGGTATFANAEFSGGTVAFNGTRFCGSAVDFSGAEFSGGTVDFSRADFSGSPVTFVGVEFSGGRVAFSGARFSSSTVDFSNTRFSGGTVAFNVARFSGGAVDFNGAKFSDGKVDFSNAEFCGGTVDIRLAKFTGGTVDFSRAEFSSGTVAFRYAEFSGGTVDFNGAEFSGGMVDFGRAEFCGGKVDLSTPRIWATPPKVIDEVAPGILWPSPENRMVLGRND